ncbi:sigma-70 family RNA polymerase sigma factor [Nocardioides sp.]|uniref:sigma-70 family RNA polymerase sigma factor n=1 Tax=Nocardioides sp. TaxID=35761 RepID=UPI00261DEC80|nr:sigma-70 family RNA polymerase sigma factor [Nocardioides sp.]
MPSNRGDIMRGLDALRMAVAAAMCAEPTLVSAAAGPAGWLLSEASGAPGHVSDGPLSQGSPEGPSQDDRDLATSSEESEADRTRLIALVELARRGDTDAFGLLYDHYNGAVYRFLYYRTRSQTLAEDLTSETFFRALRSMTGFRWQGKDFGAWLMTIARNLATDHFKAGRTRLEYTTEDMGIHDDETESPEAEVLAGLTNEILMQALAKLPDEQRDCVVMRFLQGMSIAETATVLGRSEGAIKQLQLRGVRNLAKLMPEGLR